MSNKYKVPAIYHKVLQTIQVPESLLAHRIREIESNLPAHIKLAYLPNLNIVRLRLSGIGEATKIQVEIEKIADEIKQILGDVVFSDEDISLPELLFRKLEKSGATLSVAESCTGGFISHRLTSISGISRVFVGSVVSYSNSVKHHQLGVESTLFETVGAVSEQVVTQMATGVRERLQTDYSIAISGIAGPDGGSEDKPVGTVVIGISSKSETRVQTFRFTGERMMVIERSANLAFDLLRRMIP